MSVRTRLAGILAAVMLVPLLVAGAIAGLFAPHQQVQAARDLVSQSATSLGTLEAEVCRGLGDSASALALVRAERRRRQRRPPDRGPAVRQLRPRRARRHGRGQGRACCRPTPTATCRRSASSARCPAPRATSSTGSLPVLAERVDVQPGDRLRRRRHHGGGRAGAQPRPAGRDAREPGPAQHGRDRGELPGQRQRLDPDRQPSGRADRGRARAAAPRRSAPCWWPRSRRCRVASRAVSRPPSSRAAWPTCRTACCSSSSSR